MNSIRSIFYKIFGKISSALLSLLAAIGLISGTIAPGADIIKFKNNDEIKVSAVFLSDIHIKDDDVSTKQLQRALDDINKAEKAFDLLVLPGDITDKGNTFNLAWQTLENSGVPATILPAMGNHDVGSTFENAKQEISAKASRYTGQKIDKTYYSYDKNGYTFIVMGSDEPTSEKAHISAEQLSFLDSELERGTKDGKPTFVICHFPLENTHGLPDVWRVSGGDIGAQSGEIREILTKYKNVFYINGHLHTGISKHSLEVLDEENGVYSINLPAYGQPNALGTFKNSGIGTYMQVYENEVIFTARNFKDSKALSGYERSFELK